MKSLSTLWLGLVFGVAVLTSATARVADGRTRALALTTPTVDATALLDWAEYKYPTLFAKGPQNYPYAAAGVLYTVRAYPGSRYLGVTEAGQVYGLGDFTGNVLRHFGHISDLAALVVADQCKVYPANCVVPPPQTSRVFALTDVGDSAALLDGYAARTTVDGLAFRGSWRALEPRAGGYDWTTLDAALDTVRARGKQLTLHVGASAQGLPSWLSGLGVLTYSYATPMGATVTEPVPWDATFLARYMQFVAALAAHIQSRGDMALLYAVSDGVPVAEMSIVGCLNGSLTGGIAYSRSNYLNAWKSTVEAHAAAFPTTPLLISAPVAVVCRPDNDGKAFYTELMNHALSVSANAAVFAADLNAAGSARLGQVDASIRARAAIAFQTIWSSTNDPQGRMQGTLKEAVCSGIASGARYFEIYKSDLSSADAVIQDAIQRARAGQPC